MLCWPARPSDELFPGRELLLPPMAVPQLVAHQPGTFLGSFFLTPAELCLGLNCG